MAPSNFSPAQCGRAYDSSSFFITRLVVSDHSGQNLAYIYFEAELVIFFFELLQVLVLFHQPFISAIRKRFATVDCRQRTPREPHWNGLKAQRQNRQTHRSWQGRTDR